MRPSRILAIARRDLAMELKGRQGLVLPVVMAALLVPTATIPAPTSLVDLGPAQIPVSGDVPEAVAALPGIERREQGASLGFRQEGGVLLVDAPAVPPEVRRALDGPEPVVRVEVMSVPLVFPGRTMLFALISASTLTGAVSASLGGERSRRTLVVLLSGAISRGEVVAGKWVAWGGLGAAVGLSAALLSVLFGRVEPGAWLLAVPAVPLGAVAFGLWLVRRASDVIAGSTVSLRVLPALLAITAITSWFLGNADPLLGALVPIGGACLAAGDTWDGGATVALASGSTLLFSLGCLVTTARDLEEVPATESAPRPTTLALVAGGLAALVWWVPLLVPLLWGEAGNPRLTAELSRDAGLGAGALGLLLISVARAARVPEPLRDLGDIARPRATAIAVAVAAGALLALATLGFGGVGPAEGLAAHAARRLTDAHTPALGGVGLGLLTVVADELLFRGWLARAAGPVRAGVAYAAVKTPLDPIGALLSATFLGGVGHRLGLVAALITHATWWALTR